VTALKPVGALRTFSVIVVVAGAETTVVPVAVTPLIVSENVWLKPNGIPPVGV
jgi:hypothetical protein